MANIGHILETLINEEDAEIDVQEALAKIVSVSFHKSDCPL